VCGYVGVSGEEGMGLTSGCPRSRRFSSSVGKRPDLSSSLGFSMLEEMCSHFCVLELFPFAVEKGYRKCSLLLRLMLLHLYSLTQELEFMSP
jgi:hypothetical protein